MLEPLQILNEQVKDKGIAILKPHRDKLQEWLSDIGPGFLFDKTNEVLKDKGKDIITIPKYEETLIEHSRHIIESDKSIKPLLDKIEDLVDDDGDDEEVAA